MESDKSESEDEKRQNGSNIIQRGRWVKDSLVSLKDTSTQSAFLKQQCLPFVSNSQKMFNFILVYYLYELTYKKTSY